MSVLEIILLLIVAVLFISNCVWIERYIKANEFADKVERWRHEDITQYDYVIKFLKKKYGEMDEEVSKDE